MLIFGRINFNHYRTMKKIYSLVFVLMACYSAHAQIDSGEKFIGGTFSVVSANGTSSTMVTPEFKYAHADNRLVGVTAGIVAGGANTAFVIGPNYTWAFPIQDNLFWLLSGYGNVTFGDYSDFTLGVYPGLGYRIHDRIIVALTNNGLSYSTNSELFIFNAGLSALGIRAYLRIGK